MPLLKTFKYVKVLYADWNGNKLYNGYSWLTSADYGEGSSLTDHKDRYSERSLDFMRNGGIHRLQRHGLKADGIYGKVDNLHISYEGNRISKVLEDAEAVTTNGSMDYPGPKREMSFGYNEWGATHTTSLNGVVTAKSTTEYHGNVIYRDGKLDMVLFPGGYATVNGTTVTFHYYTQDYLGNNRAVINGSTGAIEQTIAYYPYGAVIADLGTPTTGQPYKFGGKELLTANGLNEYDFGARNFYPTVPGFTMPDRKAEKYPWLSTYLYCANNPINAFDPDGNVIIFVNGFHMGDGGQSKYWNGIDKTIMNITRDYNPIYFDGALGGVTGLGNFTDFVNKSESNLNIQDRISAGYDKGYSECTAILNMAEKTGTSVKFVTHSMGSAYTKGLIKGMMKFADDNKLDIADKLTFEVDFAPFQSSEQSPVIEKTFVFQHSFDGIAGDKPIKGATQLVTHKNPSYNLFNSFMLIFKEHSISGFLDDIYYHWELMVK